MPCGMVRPWVRQTVGQRALDLGLAIEGRLSEGFSREPGTDGHGWVGFGSVVYARVACPVAGYRYDFNFVSNLLVRNSNKFSVCVILLSSSKLIR
jgi:hypothetical protein